jgi:hypothetical protein
VILPQLDYCCVDEGNLINLIHSHALTGRFLKRLTTDDTVKFTQKFRTNLYQLHTKIKKQVKKNLNAFCFIQSRLPDATQLICIKGFSTYVLVGKEEVFRFGDIDLLCKDNQALIETLIKLQYKQTRMPFLHELGEYTKGSIEVDLHSHFPIFSYGESFQYIDFPHSSKSAILQQNCSMKQQYIGFDTLLKHSLNVNTSSTINVRVADPNMLALIICAHSFMNYVNMWSISHRQKAYIRLGELADLFDLARHPAFDKNTFLALVTQFEGHDTVEWAVSMTQLLLGKSPFPFWTLKDKKLSFSGLDFPRCLWWNFWTTLQIGRAHV